MKLFRSQGRWALPSLLLLSSPAWAESYSDNMHIQEYIVGLAALVLIVWDIGRRFMQRSADSGPEVPEAGPANPEAVRKARDFGVWTRIGEVILNHPFETSLLITAFALLNFARVPFSLSAVLVGTITYLSMVLGARLASQPAVRPAAEARPIPQPAVADNPVERRPAEAAVPDAAKPAVEAQAEASAAAKPAEIKVEAPIPAPASTARRRVSGNGAAPRPNRRRTTKPKAS